MAHSPELPRGARPLPRGACSRCAESRARLSSCSIGHLPRSPWRSGATATCGRSAVLGLPPSAWFSRKTASGERAWKWGLHNSSSQYPVVDRDGQLPIPPARRQGGASSGRAQGLRNGSRPRRLRFEDPELDARALGASSRDRPAGRHRSRGTASTVDAPCGARALLDFLDITDGENERSAEL